MVHQKKYFHEFDFLRGLAAITVFMSHSLGVYDIKQFPLTLFSDGHAAVILFFVLSGFVLMYQSLNTQYNSYAFLIRRFFRIYPAFIISILLAYFLKEVIYDNYRVYIFPEIWLNEFSLDLLFKTLLLIGPSFDSKVINSVIWSLIVEMRVSIIFPIFILLFKKVDDFKILLAILILIILIPLFIQNISLFQYIPIFYLGALYAKYFHQINRFIANFKVIYFLIILYFFGNYSTHFNIENKYLIDLIISIGSLFIMVAFTSFVLTQKISKFNFSTLIGKTSYSFYLLHQPILLTLVSVFYFTNSFLMILSSFFITIIISYIILKVIELPFVQLGKKLTKGLK